VTAMLAGQAGAEKRQENRDQARVVREEIKRGGDGDYDYDCLVLQIGIRIGAVWKKRGL
jgi:hypothetical protein